MPKQTINTIITKTHYTHVLPYHKRVHQTEIGYLFSLSQTGKHMPSLRGSGKGSEDLYTDQSGHVQLDIP